MSPLLIVGLIVLALVVAVFLFGLTPEPGKRREPGMLKRRSKWHRLIPVVPLLGAIACLVLAFGGFRFSVFQASPIAVLVMDVSESMEETDIGETRLQAAQQAALEFLDELPPDFEVGLVTFSSDVSPVVAPTTERVEVAEAVNAFETSTGTFIWDGVAAGLDAIEQRRAGSDAPAAILLMSDGRDTGSSATSDGIADRAVTMEVPINAVLLGQAGGERGANIAELRAASDPTGGETLTAETAGQLTERFREIGTRFSVDLAADPSTTPFVVAAIALVVLAGILVVVVQR